MSITPTYKETLSKKELQDFLEGLAPIRNAIHTLRKDFAWAEEHPHPAIGSRGYGREFATMRARNRLDYADFLKIAEAFDKLELNAEYYPEQKPASRTEQPTPRTQTPTSPVRAAQSQVSSSRSAPPAQQTRPLQLSTKAPGSPAPQNVNPPRSSSPSPQNPNRTAVSTPSTPGVGFQRKPQVKPIPIKR